MRVDPEFQATRLEKALVNLTERASCTWLVVLRIVAGALGFRCVSAFLALLVNVVFPLHAPSQFYVFCDSPSPFWDTFARFDTGYFQGIAWDGYAPLAMSRLRIWR